jgi:PAS domain S-box-containing protein
MTAKKKQDDRGTDNAGMVRSLREEAEERLSRSPQRSPEMDGQTAEKLIHELRVHQIELETQAEELRRTQLALTESRDKYLDLYDFAPVGYITLSSEAIIEDVNLTGATLLGIERGSLIKTRFRKFITPDYAEHWDRYFVNVLNKGEKHSCSLVLARGDGSLFPALLESIRTTDQAGGKTTVRVILSDITNIRRVEAALRISNKKLTLLSSITRHDINNQLLSLNGFLELFHDELKNPAYDEYFTRISNASSRISTIIRFTKEYENVGVNAPVWQDCRTLIAAAAKQANPGKIRIQNDLPAGSLVFADPLVIKVCYNLIENAILHGGKITTITFSAQERDGRYIVVCEDDGAGIAAGDKERIFDRGFGKNTGYGLTLAREILGITDIMIRETGEAGRGARFEMTVPKGAYRHVPGPA